MRPMKYNRLIRIAATACLCLAPGFATFAQNSEDEIKAMMEAMEAAGLDPAQMQQMEQVMQQIGAQEQQRKAARQDTSDWEFDELTEGRGNAFVAIDGQELTMRVIRCETINMQTGVYSIEAQVSLNPDNGRLLINTYGNKAEPVLQYTDDYRQYRVEGVAPQFDGQNLNWSGRANGPEGAIEMSVRLTCRAIPGEERPAATGPLGAPANHQPDRDTSENPLTRMMQFEMGKPVIHILGSQKNAAASQSAEQTIVGDCDKATPEDDLDVMTFSAPWKIVGSSSGGAGPGSTVGKRSLMFERSGDIPQIRLTLDFKQELKRTSILKYLDDHAVIARIPFAGDEVRLVYVNQTTNLKFGYHAVFPIAQLEGFPMNMQESGRYLAHVHFGPVGPLNLDAWPETDIIDVFKSLRTSHCLGSGLKSELASFSPTVVFD